jgi:plastocyanin
MPHREPASVRVVAAALFVLLASVATAIAEEQLVTQKKLQFQQNDAKLAAIVIKPGDVLLFRNDDRLAHNVFSRTPGQEFDLGIMRPGGSGTQTFTKPGALDVECALHPQMKFKLQVEP